MLSFDPVAHRYTYNGLHVPNVTSVLSPLTSYAMVNPEKLETARQKGVAIHKMVELWCKNDLDETTLPEWMRPALDQWKKFVTESGFRIFQSEVRVFHKTYRYAGTLDLVGNIDRSIVYIDVKRSFLAGASIGYQLAAYAEADGAKHYKRFALKLREDGQYRLEPFTDKMDFTNFLTCLNFYRLQEKHKCHQ